jgi:homoserine kinase type II
MTAPAQPGAGVPRLLREYDLGRLVSAAPLSGGNASVLHVRAEGGDFVLKPAFRPSDVELQAGVARYLSDRGVRQALVRPTRAGAVVSEDGYFLQEFLPGAIAARPTEGQTLAAMAAIGAYHRELAGYPGSYVPDADSLWQRVADPDYLVTALPGLLAGRGLAGRAELAGVHALDQARPVLAALPQQLVHGDIGPDNILMDGDEAVAIIDFTPHLRSVLLAACTALYWYHVIGRPEVDPAGVRASLTAIGGQRPWSEAELALWPVGLLWEAQRRLATTLALAATADPASTPASPRPAADSAPTPADSAPADRHAALLAVVRMLDSR